MNLINTVQLWIVKQLDALKVKNVYVFLLIQSVLGSVASAFGTGVFHVATPDFIAGLGIDLNMTITTLLVGIMGLIGPRTTQVIAENK